LDFVSLSLITALVFGVSEKILTDARVENCEDILPWLLFFPFLAIWPIRQLPIGRKNILIIFNLLMIYYIIINTIYLRRIKNFFQENNK
jgi:hypothetical protein